MSATTIKTTISITLSGVDVWYRSYKSMEGKIVMWNFWSPPPDNEKVLDLDRRYGVNKELKLSKKPRLEIFSLRCFRKENTVFCGEEDSRIQISSRIATTLWRISSHEKVAVPKPRGRVEFDMFDAVGYKGVITIPEARAPVLSCNNCKMSVTAADVRDIEVWIATLRAGSDAKSYKMAGQFSPMGAFRIHGVKYGGVMFSKFREYGVMSWSRLFDL